MEKKITIPNPYTQIKDSKGVTVRVDKDNKLYIDDADNIFTSTNTKPIIFDGSSVSLGTKKEEPKDVDSDEYIKELKDKFIAEIKRYQEEDTILPKPKSVEFTETLHILLRNIKEFLLEKNKRYGNSALEPSNMFFKGDSEEGLLIRIDDKLKRIKNSQELRKNDVIDLIGYLIILCMNKEWTDFSEFID